MAEGLNNLKQQLRQASVEAQSLNAQLIALRDSSDAIDASRISELESRMQASVQRAAELRDTINDTNEQIAVLAGGSEMERFSNQLGDIGGKIASLDFAGASESAQRLVTLSKQMTFATAVQSVKDLGSTFISLGKALLTNPLFILAGAITLIVVAVVKLMDKLGFLETITEAVGQVFEWFGEMIDLASDALWAMVEGLDAAAAAERNLARQMNEDADVAIERFKEMGTTREATLDRQIKLAESEGKSTKELEREKLKVIGATILAEKTALEIKLKNAEKYGLLTKEELRELKKQITETNDAYKGAIVDIKVFDNKTAQEDKDKRDKANADAKARNEKAKADREREAKERLSLARQTEDILLSIKKDGEEKDIELVTVRFDRLIADNKKNIELVKALELQKQFELDQVKMKYDQKEIDQEKAFQATLAEINKSAIDNEKDKIELEKQEKLNKLAEAATEEQKLRQEYLDAQYTIEEEAKNKLKELDDKAAADKKAKDEEIAANEKALAQEKIDNATREREAKIAIANDIVNGLSAIGNAFIKDQKKLENFNKASALVQIGIDTARAISALVAASQANPLNGPTGGIAGAAQFASGIVQIITNIAKAKQLLSGSGSTPSPSSSSSNGSNSSSSSFSNVSSGGNNNATPSFSLFGTAGNYNTTNASQQNSETNTNQQMNISVSVEEINSVQNRVAKIRESASL